ncbi:hypothetical protein [Massilia sp. BJB1822]|uniref:hypothetical protein n=1 Tax=Massilia sp. BJB1822 TaxID=2744470 RepID=UPI001594D8F3|nr:hypothetical protein [Massilia sp. BJB1822]NVD99402.1 hypothetical protein [Massilia sp. BJB1822]
MKPKGWHFELQHTELASGGESYVGLVRDAEGKARLRLPYGYRLDQGESKEACLGQLSRVLARFARSYPRERRSEREGYLSDAEGRREQTDGPPELGYAKLASLVELIRRLGDPQLLALVRIPGLAAGFDERHISRNLERAVYLPDHTPYFETMWARPPQMRQTRNDLVGLACWIALDALRHLFPGAMDEEIAPNLLEEWETLAARFADSQHLSQDASLFGNGHEATLPHIQDALAAITRTEPPVHAQARELAELLGSILHYSANAGGGEIFGLKGFYRVWEAACLEYALEEFGAARILSCDHELLDSVSAPQRQLWTDARRQICAWNGMARRPDLIVRLDDGRLLLIDFKYSSAYAEESFFKRRPQKPGTQHQPANRLAWLKFCEELKLHQDIANLESYRWLLMQRHLRNADESLVETQIWIPAQQDSQRHCAWQTWDKSLHLPDTGYRQLSVRGVPAATILRHYARKFTLFS